MSSNSLYSRNFLAFHLACCLFDPENGFKRGIPVEAKRRRVKFHVSLCLSQPFALKMQHFVFGNTSTLTPKTAAEENSVCLAFEEFLCCLYQQLNFNSFYMIARLHLYYPYSVLMLLHVPFDIVFGKECRITNPG